jgi:hypothetical protein
MKSKTIEFGYFDCVVIIISELHQLETNFLFLLIYGLRFLKGIKIYYDHQIVVVVIKCEMKCPRVISEFRLLVDFR